MQPSGTPSWHTDGRVAEDSIVIRPMACFLVATDSSSGYSSP